MGNSLDSFTGRLQNGQFRELRCHLCIHGMQKKWPHSVLVTGRRLALYSLALVRHMPHFAPSSSSSVNSMVVCQNRDMKYWTPTRPIRFRQPNMEFSEELNGVKCGLCQTNAKEFKANQSEESISSLFNVAPSYLLKTHIVEKKFTSPIQFHPF